VLIEELTLSLVDDFRVAARGSRFHIVFACGGNGKYEAEEFLDELKSDANGIRHYIALYSLFERMAETGLIFNREQFKKVDGDIWEFKKFQCRVLGFFAVTGRGLKCFFLTNGCKKKGDKLPPQVVERAKRIRSEWLELLKEQR